MPLVYTYYIRRGIAALRLDRVFRFVVLHELGVVNVDSKRSLNRINVWREAVAANLRAVDDPLGHVGHEGASRGLGALAGDE